MTLYINACPREESRTARLARAYLARISDVTELNIYDQPFVPLDRERLAHRESLIADGKCSAALDENGEAPGSIDGERCFRMEFVMEASEAMPEQLYVKLYNLDTNEYGKTVVIPLTPTESEGQ